MEYGVVNREAIYVQVMEHIRDWILDGHLNVGEQLPTEMELATSFDVSRAVIREALSALKVLGLIESRQGSGNFIANPGKENQVFGLRVERMVSKGNPLQILESRKILETEIAYLAALRRTDEDLSEMRQTLDAMKEAVQRNEDMVSGADFHMAIAKATHNPALIAMAEVGLHTMNSELWDVLSERRREIPRQKYLSEHEDIYTAIKIGDATEARQTAQRHFESMEADLVGSDLSNE